MSTAEEVWNRVAAEHPEFTPAHDISGNFRAVEEIVLGGSLTWRRAHELFKPRPGMVVLDIGANAGIYSAFCGANGATVYAFEPGRNSFDLLSRMVSQSGLANVHPIKAAISDINGLDRTVEHGIENNGLFYFNGGLQSKGIHWSIEDLAKSEVIPVMTLDSVIFVADDIDCVKIDVEGSEADIILAATPRTLRKIRFMYIEVHDWMGRALYDEMLEYLREHCQVEGYVHPVTGLFEAIYCTQKI
jgi:FkbM family methyltransferase